MREKEPQTRVTTKAALDDFSYFTLLKQFVTKIEPYDRSAAKMPAMYHVSATTNGSRPSDRLCPGDDRAT
jgi:hypothetical protein